MKNCKVFLIALAAFAAVSCGNKAVVNGTVSGLAGGNLVVKQLDAGSYSVLDSLQTDDAGAFTCKVKVNKGQPEFVYVFYGDRCLASLLLQSGDRVKVSADTLGNYSVEGSEECAKLCSVEKDYVSFISSLADATSSSEASRVYVDFYRKSVKYIIENSRSLTVVPVMMRKMSDGFPVFSQSTDAIHFRNICDSLSAVYPDSKYLRALEKEAARRKSQMDINIKLNEAGEIGFPDLLLPDISGKKVALSSVDAKVVLVYFWTPAQAEQSMVNIEVLKPIYDEFRAKGLEVYAIGVDTDKAAWASVVRNQGLEWINVNDGLGTQSPALMLYNVSAIPALYMIENGEITNDSSTTVAELRRSLAEKLK